MTDKLKESFQKELEEAKKKSYSNLVDETKPKTPYFKNIFFAFLIGGLICCLGQLCFELFFYYGLGEKDSITLSLVVLIFLGIFLTGLGLYDDIGKLGGAGSIVPISGFANSMVSPALEWKTEGFIVGLGAKMFTVVGPVIIYGITGSVVLGFIKYIYLYFKGGF